MYHHNRHRPVLSSSRRGGAVIIVVLSLLTTLLFLGLFFYNWTGQERANAELFAAQSDTSGIVPEDIFDFGLRQVIVSVPQGHYDSALFAEDGAGNGVTFWSLLAQQVGPLRADGSPVDAQIQNGRGITIKLVDTSPADGIPDNEIDTNNDTFPDYPGFRLDYNGDGVDDADQTSFVLNYSRVANGNSTWIGGSSTNHQNFLFYPDAGYTYPDINNPFLALDYDYNSSGSTVRVIKPSFSLPGYMPLLRSQGFTNAYRTQGTYRLNPNQSFRPHESHAYAAPGTLIANNNTNRRYIVTSQQALSGDTNRVLDPYDFSGGSWGVWQGGTTYTFDRDLDLDGIDDSIDIDLDHPIIELPNGRQVVPIFQYKIVDLDSLLNLNVHGQAPYIVMNSNSSTANMKTMAHDWTDWIHQSQFGLSPSEVNPQIALFADPQDTNFLDNTDRAIATYPHRAYVANHSTVPPTDTTLGPNGITRQQISNLETAMLLFGRPEYSPNDLSYTGDVDYIGRYGEDGSMRLRNGLHNGYGTLPVPGAFGLDDDGNDGNNSNDGYYYNPTNGRGGLARFDSTRMSNVAIPPFVHPLDYTGLGDRNIANGAAYLRSTVVTGDVLGARVLGSITPPLGGTSPLRWPQYPSASYWQNPGFSESNYYGHRTLRGTIAGTSELLPDSVVANDLLLNNANEAVAYSGLASANDNLFGPSEIGSLHLSDADWVSLGLSSRLQTLMPFNLQTNKFASRIRKQFTTESWDRTEFSYAPLTGLTAGTRQWEWNDDRVLSSTGPSATLRFPPKFSTVIPSRHEYVDSTPASYTSTTTLPLDGLITPNDPFRPEVRQLLTVDFNLGNIPDRARHPQQRLHLNRILSDDTLAGGYPAFDDRGNPQYRDLVPHVTKRDTFSTGAALETMIYANLTYTEAMALAPTHPYRQFATLQMPTLTDGVTTNSPPYDDAIHPQIQEWWARYDRQRMAQDIYVLLYTLAGPDGIDVTQGALDANVAREMAQFAVNYVDAMDRDDVITKFAYDANLSDGWNPTETVYGVESQQLAFSEVLLIETVGSGTDEPATLVNENNDNHRFLYVELRNPSPLSVDFNNQSWRLVRLNSTTFAEERWAELHTNTPSAPGGTVKSVPPGENFIIACHDGHVENAGNQPVGSEFYADINTGTPGLEIVVPKFTGTGATITDNNQIPNGNHSPNNIIDLDLSSVDSSPTQGDQYYATFGGVAFGSDYQALKPQTLVESYAGGNAATSPNFVLSLQRRLNPYAGGVGETEWVEVDRVLVEPKLFNPASGVVTALTNNVKSQERLHHFAPDLIDYPGTASPRNHSLDADVDNKHLANERLRLNLPTANPSTDTDFRIFQPHYDRDLTSVIDLLSVPLYGCWTSISTGTWQIDQHGGVTRNLVDTLTGDGVWRLSGGHTAAVRFLYPNGSAIPTTAMTAPSAPAAYDNRWYRLLEFIGNPPSADDAVESRLATIRRSPGKINLNTLRQDHILAGLVDDDIHHNAVTNRDNPTQDIYDTMRNWMSELLIARDREAVTAGGITLTLPGTPLAKPFRQFSEINEFNPNASTESTLLRRGGTSALFLGGGTPVSSALGDDFGIFEARPESDVGKDVVDYHTRNRLLAKIANNSTERSHVFAIWAGFELHEAHINSSDQVQIGAKAEDLPDYRMFVVVDMSRLEEAYSDPDPNDNIPGTYDFRKFIIHRQLLP